MSLQEVVAKGSVCWLSIELKAELGPYAGSSEIQRF